MYEQLPHEVDFSSMRALLLEIIRRASYDWVMYRGSRRRELRSAAKDAYVWLFVEGPGHADWEERHREGWDLFSFLGICEELGIDPVRVRWHVRRLTAKRIQSMGRPPTTRRSSSTDAELSSVGFSIHGVLSDGELLNLE